MPGLFGIVSSDTEHLKKFSELYQSYSPFTHKIIQTTSYRAGLHAFQSKGILESPQHVISADGEYNIYQELANSPQELFRDNGAYIKPTEKHKGNLCIYDKNHENIYLATDILGSFPYYYSIIKNAFVFSFHNKTDCRK